MKFFESMADWPRKGTLTFGGAVDRGSESGSVLAVWITVQTVDHGVRGH